MPLAAAIAACVGAPSASSLVEKLATLPHPLPALTSPAMPSRIVNYVHRPKRPARKKAQAAAIAGPAIVTAKSALPEHAAGRAQAARRCGRQVRELTGKPPRGD
jgi:hypothetical protein